MLADLQRGPEPLLSILAGSTSNAGSVDLKATLSEQSSDVVVRGHQERSSSEIIIDLQWILEEACQIISEVESGLEDISCAAIDAPSQTTTSFHVGG